MEALVVEVNNGSVQSFLSWAFGLINHLSSACWYYCDLLKIFRNCAKQVVCVEVFSHVASANRDHLVFCGRIIIYSILFVPWTVSGGNT